MSDPSPLLSAKDMGLANLDNLPESHEFGEEIIENWEAGLNSFREVIAVLRRCKARQRYHSSTVGRSHETIGIVGKPQ